MRMEMMIITGGRLVESMQWGTGVMIIKIMMTGGRVVGY